ncbi:unnamed protein product [Brachionus calyciflorus]|uniref:Uncharacterized protein n=1 Tax=Brachionus calyciflorus TaxID=104777 RepID=A0A814QSJ5_9BILA|nr:unnamed protein product [Brachionus calyciflorus]
MNSNSLSKIFVVSCNKLRKKLFRQSKTHNLACWVHFLRKTQSKVFGCEGVRLTRNKLICNKRSVSLPNLNEDKFSNSSFSSASMEEINQNQNHFITLSEALELDYSFDCDYY